MWHRLKKARRKGVGRTAPRAQAWALRGGVQVYRQEKHGMETPQLVKRRQENEEYAWRMSNYMDLSQARWLSSKGNSPCKKELKFSDSVCSFLLDKNTDLIVWVDAIRMRVGRDGLKALHSLMVPTNSLQYSVFRDDKNTRKKRIWSVLYTEICLRKNFYFYKWKQKQRESW